MEGGRNSLRRSCGALIALALIAPAVAGAAPAIEQYGSELGAEVRPEVGGASFRDPVVPSPGGVAGEGEPAISGLESLGGAVTQPLGLIAAGIAALLIVAGRRPDGMPA